jgi:hypothetical protein
MQDTEKTAPPYHSTQTPLTMKVSKFMRYGVSNWLLQKKRHYEKENWIKSTGGIHTLTEASWVVVFKGWTTGATTIFGPNLYSFNVDMYASSFSR